MVESEKLKTRSDVILFWFM